MCKNIEEDRENTYSQKCWVLPKAYTGKSQFDKTIIFQDNVPSELNFLVIYDDITDK